MRSHKWMKEAGVVLLLAAISMAVLYPMMGSFFSKLPFAKNGDVRLSLCILLSNLNKITHLQPNQVYHLPLVFPFSFTMTAGVNLFGQTLLILPLYLAGNENLYSWYNLLVLLAFVAAGYCAYLFIRELVGGRAVAIAVAAVYLLLPLRIHSVPQLNLMYNFPIPLALLFFLRFWKSEKRRDLFLFIGSLLLQFLFDLSLGFFLSIALGIFFIFHVTLSRPRKKISFFASLAVAGAILLVILAVIFSPYIKKDISFSNITEIDTIERNSFHPALSFYANWSYILLSAKKILWGYEPQSPGLLVSLLFLFAFIPALASRLEKVLFGLVSAFLLLPIPLVIGLTHRVSFAALERIADISLGLLLSTFLVMLLVLRKRLAGEVFLLSLTWIALQFFSSQICFRSANLFQLLSRVFPFLLRTRGIRTQYILLLLFLAVSAYGLRRIWQQKKFSMNVFAAIVVLLFAERFRWPVSMDKLEDDRPTYRQFYRQIDSLPDHYGLLELPFCKQQHLNHYPLYTRFHNKHTYHGLISYLSDPLGLEGSPAWTKSTGFPGLKDPDAIRTLRKEGIRIIMLFKDKIFSGLPQDRQEWRATQENIRRGAELELYERVENSNQGILLVLSGREKGEAITASLPYFALAANRTLGFILNSESAAPVIVRFNGRLIHELRLPAGTKKEITLTISELPLRPQSNILTIACEKPVVFENLILKK